MNLKKIKGFLFIATIAVLFSCNYKSARMLETPNGYEFDQPILNDSSEFIISIGDIITFSLYTNDGTQLIDLTAISNTGTQQSTIQTVQYFVEFDGFSKLPILGRTELAGLTMREAEKLLEDKYAKYYIKPFVTLRVTNRRVTIFPGTGKGTVITLVNENTTLLEALAKAGGLDKLGKSKNIKLVRGNLKNPKVFQFDLSTIDGINKTDFVLQANDIIYVESRTDLWRETMRDVLPALSLITSTVTLIVLINNLK